MCSALRNSLCNFMLSTENGSVESLKTQKFKNMSCDTSHKSRITLNAKLMYRHSIDINSKEDQPKN